MHDDGDAVTERVSAILLSIDLCSAINTPVDGFTSGLCSLTLIAEVSACVQSLTHEICEESATFVCTLYPWKVERKQRNVAHDFDTFLTTYGSKMWTQFTSCKFLGDVYAIPLDTASSCACVTSSPSCLKCAISDVGAKKRSRSPNSRLVSSLSLSLSLSLSVSFSDPTLYRPVTIADHQSRLVGFSDCITLNFSYTAHHSVVITTHSQIASNAHEMFAYLTIDTFGAQTDEINLSSIKAYLSYYILSSSVLLK